MRWTASPGAAGYRVFWREAWAPDWQHERTVGAVTELLLPGLSMDDQSSGSPPSTPTLTRAWLRHMR